ncbi:MAG: tyrosine-type recombinase/integrase [Phycisphaerae bacterium]
MRRSGSAAPNKRVRASRRLPPEVLTDDEVRRLLVACRPTTPTGLRHHALIALLYRTGLRIREALDLFPKDIDLDAGVIRVLRGKCGYAHRRHRPRRAAGYYSAAVS